MAAKTGRPMTPGLDSLKLPNARIGMSDLILRAQQALRGLNDPTLPKWQRLFQGLKAYSGLVLTGLDEEIQKRLEAGIAGVNHMLAEYDLVVDEDYQNIDLADLDEMHGRIDQTSAQVIDLELERILAGLDAGAWELPKEAIQETREHRDLMAPRLIEVLWETLAEARAGDLPEGEAHFFAIFLLTELQVEEAFPAILEVFSLPDELPMELFGDVVTDTWPRILAHFAGSRPEVLESLICGRALNEYVRAGACLSYFYLLRDGCLERDEVVGRLRQHLCQAIDCEDEQIVGYLVNQLSCFASKEAIEEIREAYRRGLVDACMIDLEEVERDLAEGENRILRELKRCPPTGIEDTIEELRHWATYKEEPVPVPDNEPLPTVPNYALKKQPAKLTPDALGMGGVRVGRNQPCPCGSGKKFKKCCGLPQ
jgi:uncharacterized protein DUF1186/SEC-C motif-containing protein